MKCNERIPYAVIVQATRGDAIAMEQVMRRYAPYAAALATRSYIDGSGVERQAVDEDMMHQIQAHLACKVLLFDPWV